MEEKYYTHGNLPLELVILHVRILSLPTSLWKERRHNEQKPPLPSAYNPTTCVLLPFSQPYYKSLHSKFPTNYLSEDEAPPVVQVVERRPRKTLCCCTRKILSTKLHHPTTLVVNHYLPQLVITTRPLTRWTAPHSAEAQLPAATAALRTEWHRNKPPKISMCYVEKRRNWRDIWRIVLLRYQQVCIYVFIYCLFAVSTV